MVEKSRKPYRIITDKGPMTVVRCTEQGIQLQAQYPGHPHSIYVYDLPGDYRNKNKINVGDVEPRMIGMGGNDEERKRERKEYLIRDKIFRKSRSKK